MPNCKCRACEPDFPGRCFRDVYTHCIYTCLLAANILTYNHYHAWTYARDGQLMSAQFMYRTQGFEVEDCRLPVLNSEVWGGFVFVNLSGEAPPLGEQLTALEPEVGNYHMQDMRRFTGGDEIWPTN